MSVSMATLKGTKLAGQTKFDLAEYMNRGKKGCLCFDFMILISFILSTEKVEEIPVLKCLDKTAKFHFTIKFTPIAEMEGQLPQ